MLNIKVYVVNASKFGIVIVRNNLIYKSVFVLWWQKPELTPIEVYSFQGTLKESFTSLPIKYQAEQTRGVTIYWYIAIHEEFISYRNTKFVSQYIMIFLSSN